MIKDKCIVLKKVKFSESDLILHALTKQGEKIGFIAKGALRSKKRFPGGVLDPTNYISVMYSPKKTNTEEGALHFLNEAQLIDGFEGLRTDYSRLEMALYFVSIIDKLSVEGCLDSEGLFNVLGHSLKCLQTTDEIGLLKFHFEAKILQQQGVLPEALQNPYVFNLSILQHEQISEKIKASELERLTSVAAKTLGNYLN